MMEEGHWVACGMETIDRLASMELILAVPSNVTARRVGMASDLRDAVEAAMLTARVHLMFGGHVFERSNTIQEYGFTDEVASMALRRLVARGDATYETDGRQAWFACREEANDGCRTRARRGARTHDRTAATGQLTLL